MTCLLDYIKQFVKYKPFILEVKRADKFDLPKIGLNITKSLNLKKSS
jgi:hypothetical protein